MTARLSLTRPARTIAQTAELLGLHHETVYQAVRAGEIPAIRIGQQWLIPVTTLAAMLDTTPSGTPPPALGKTAMSVREASDILGIGTAALYQAAARGDIPATRVGRRILISGPRLAAMLAIRTSRGNDDRLKGG